VAVDLQTEVVIDRPAAEVAGYAGDPTNAPRWYRNIESVEWQTPPPIAVGSRMAFVARFLGRRLAYTYEVSELVPERRLVMRTAEGPLPMETTYTWEPLDANRTRMTLRNRGGSYPIIPASIQRAAIRRATQRDLLALKQFLENR
jgi:uncharacterized membrane protein